jgi:O-antigen/teichoic acid export membrane protein
MSYTKIAVKGAATVFIISIVAGLLGYFVRLTLARTLSIENFGLFYSVFAFLAMLSIFKSLGIDKSLIKFIPEFQHKKSYNEIKSSIIYVAIVQLITNTIIITIIYLISSYLGTNFFQNPNADAVLKLMAIAFYIDSFMLIIKFSFQGFKKMGLFAGIDLVRMLIIVTIILIGLELNYKLLSPIIAYIVAPIILILTFGYILIKKVFPKFNKSKFIYDNKLLTKLSKYGIFVMATGVGNIILGNTDIILLTYFSGLTPVALYSVALPTARLFLYFPNAIGGIFTPLTSELWIKKKKLILKEGIESLYKYSLIIIIPLVFMVLSFSELLLTVFYGKEFASASDTLKILSVGMIFASLFFINLKFFAGIGKPKINSKIVYSVAIFNLAANLILIPVLGIVGAAITTTLSYFIMMLMSLIKIRKFIKIELPIRTWTKTTITGLIFISIIALLKRTITLNVWAETTIVLIVSSLAYITLLFLFKVVDMDEIKGLYNRIVK